MNNVKHMIDDRIKMQMQILNSPDLTAEQQLQALQEIERLHKLRTEELAHAADDTRLEKWVNRIGGGVAKMVPVVGGWIVYSKWMTQGLHFEKTGTVVSPWVKALIGKFPK